ncbi:hypothetical protein ACH5RR_036428 [Cinchona calisaya]|uniref:PGG domain-containing protein n=1 Tax=Cinchona calisaya TaxID=153742 RepID=A0ABD2Y7T8_9GENT
MEVAIGSRFVGFVIDQLIELLRPSASPIIRNIALCVLRKLKFIMSDSLNDIIDYFDHMEDDISARDPMDPQIYIAAVSGSWSEIADLDLYSQRTATGNTVLHVLSQCSSTSSDAVRQILTRNAYLLLDQNAQKETALHLAATKGHSEVVGALIDCSKMSRRRNKLCTMMLGITDNYGNTALHKAVENNRYEVVKLLVEADTSLQYEANIAGECPLYIAAEKGYSDITDRILLSCESPSYHGPGGKTALHAAAIRNSPECVVLILAALRQLTKHVDECGWTALHYAAKYNHRQVVNLFLSADKSLSYIAARKDSGKTALHVAVIHGNLDVVQEILSHCPDCWEGITSKAQNVIHLAVENERGQVLEFIIENSWAIDLINKKDVNGNTPLHLYVATNVLQGHNLVNHPGLDRSVFNKAGLTPLDIISMDEMVTQRQMAIRDELVQAGATLGRRNNNITRSVEDKASNKSDELEHAQAYTIVATLVITVTFAAGFTVPGGFDIDKGPNEGMAVLARKAAFIVFVVSDSFAMMLSMVAVLLQFLLKDNHTLPEKLNILQNIKVCIGVAMTLMVIAFVAGLYAVQPVLAMRIYLCAVAAVVCSPLLVYLLRLALECWTAAKNDKDGQISNNV